MTGIPAPGSCTLMRSGGGGQNLKKIIMFSNLTYQSHLDRTTDFKALGGE